MSDDSRNLADDTEAQARAAFQEDVDRARAAFDPATLEDPATVLPLDRTRAALGNAFDRSGDRTARTLEYAFDRESQDAERERSAVRTALERLVVAQSARALTAVSGFYGDTSTGKGLRHTNATLIAERSAKGHESAAEVLARVKAMLGHHSERMSAHYARRAQVERSNAGTVEMLPVIGKKE